MVVVVVVVVVIGSLSVIQREKIGLEGNYIRIKKKKIIVKIEEKYTGKNSKKQYL